MNEKVQQEQVSNTFPKLEHKEAQSRVQLQIEDLIMKSWKERFQENSEGERQSVISAHEPPTTHRSEVAQETKACDSWKKRSDKTYKRGGGAKHEGALSVRSPPPGTDCQQHFTPMEWVHSPLQTSEPAEGHPQTNSNLNLCRSQDQFESISENTKKSGRKCRRRQLLRDHHPLLGMPAYHSR